MSDSFINCRYFNSFWYPHIAIWTGLFYVSLCAYIPEGENSSIKLYYTHAHFSFVNTILGSRYLETLPVQQDYSTKRRCIVGELWNPEWEMKRNGMGNEMTTLYQTWKLFSRAYCSESRQHNVDAKHYTSFQLTQCPPIVIRTTLIWQ